MPSSKQDESSFCVSVIISCVLCIALHRVHKLTTLRTSSILTDCLGDGSLSMSTFPRPCLLIVDVCMQISQTAMILAVVVPQHRKTTHPVSMTSCSSKSFNSRARYRSLWTVRGHFRNQNSKQHRVLSHPFSLHSVTVVTQECT